MPKTTLDTCERKKKIIFKMQASFLVDIVAVVAHDLIDEWMERINKKKKTMCSASLDLHIQHITRISQIALCGTTQAISCSTVTRKINK